MPRIKYYKPRHWRRSLYAYGYIEKPKEKITIFLRFGCPNGVTRIIFKNSCQS